MRRTHRGAGAEDDADDPLAPRQRAAGERDDDGVVAGENDVDADDAQDREHVVGVQAEQCLEILRD